MQASRLTRSAIHLSRCRSSWLQTRTKPTAIPVSSSTPVDTSPPVRHNTVRNAKRRMERLLRLHDGEEPQVEKKNLPCTPFAAYARSRSKNFKEAAAGWREMSDTEKVPYFEVASKNRASMKQCEAPNKSRNSYAAFVKANYGDVRAKVMEENKFDEDKVSIYKQTIRRVAILYREQHRVNR